jgi:hypothetical protein
VPNTVRIPELPSRTAGLDLSFSDLLPIYIASENKTRRVDLQSLYTFFQSGGVGGSHAPVEYGGMMIYRVPDDIPEGTTTVSIPSLAGKDFFLRRGGLPLIPQTNPSRPDAQFEIQNAGGFALVQDGDQLNPGELFELFIFSLIAQSPGPAPSTSSGAFIKGRKTISTNTVLDVEQDLNKLIQARAGVNAITVTLPNVDDVPENTFIPIETNINNTKPLTVTTTGGQFIYFKNTSKTTVYMHPGEVLWLFRDDDGWYVTSDFYQVYRQIGKPYAVYNIDVEDNEILCMGQLVNRADYPRLWEYALRQGASLVTDEVWNTESVVIEGRTEPFPYIGCFSTGDGSTTFRLPNLMNVALRGLKSTSGADPERYLNKSGGRQKNQNLKHGHFTISDESTSGDVAGVSDTKSTAKSNELNNNPSYRLKGSPIVPGLGPSSESGGTEARMDNVGILWAMKY